MPVSAEYWNRVIPRLYREATNGNDACWLWNPKGKKLKRCDCGTTTTEWGIRKTARVAVFECLVGYPPTGTEITRKKLPGCGACCVNPRHHQVSGLQNLPHAARQEIRRLNELACVVTFPSLNPYPKL